MDLQYKKGLIIVKVNLKKGMKINFINIEAMKMIKYSKT